jgi:hypothetical protein
MAERYWEPISGPLAVLLGRVVDHREEDPQEGPEGDLSRVEGDLDGLRMAGPSGRDLVVRGGSGLSSGIPPRPRRRLP